MPNDALRQNIDKALKNSKASPETKQVRPKIKLVEERQSSTEETVKKVFAISLENTLSAQQVKKSSTFYKGIEPIEEEKEPVKPK